MQFQPEMDFPHAQAVTLAFDLEANARNYQNKIKLNINKFPPDFFLKPKTRRIKSTTERFPGNQFQEFVNDSPMLDNAEMEETKKTSFFSAAKPERLATVDAHRRVRRQVSHEKQKKYSRQEELFNCTFAKKMYSQQLSPKHRNPNLNAVKSKEVHSQIKLKQAVNYAENEFQEETKAQALLIEHKLREKTGGKDRGRNFYTIEKGISPTEIEKMRQFQWILNRKMNTEVESIDKKAIPRRKKIHLPQIQSARKAK